MLKLGGLFTRRAAACSRDGKQFGPENFVRTQFTQNTEFIPAKFSRQSSENREAVSKASNPTVSSIAVDAVTDMEISAGDLTYFSSSEYDNFCSALNVNGHFDDNDSGSDAGEPTKNELNVTEDMSDFHIEYKTTDEQIAEAIRISMRQIPSPLDGVMSTPSKEPGQSYKSILNHKEPTCKDDIRNFLSDLQGLLQHEPNFLEAQRPLAGILREDTAFTWGETEQQAWDIIMSTAAQRLTDGSTKRMDHESNSDSNPEGEEYIVRPLPRGPTGGEQGDGLTPLSIARPLPRDSTGGEQGNGLTLLSTAYNGTDEEESDIENNSPTGGNICGKTPNDATSATSQVLSSTRSPRHANCILLSHDSRRGPTYGLSRADLTKLGIVLPVSNRILVKNLQPWMNEADVHMIISVCGKVTSTQVLRDDGHSRGTATVAFTHPIEAIQAIKMMKSAEFYGKNFETIQDLAGHIPVLSDQLPFGLSNGRTE